MALIKRKGFGQVELNQVSGGMIDGNLVDQVPADRDVLGDILEQGRFVKVSNDGTKLGLEGLNPWVMIYNEEHFYDERDGYHKDYAMKVEDFMDGVLVPRCYLISKNDVFTTNCFTEANTSKNAELEGDKEVSAIYADVKGGEDVIIGVDPATGFLTNEGYDEDGPLFLVIDGPIHMETMPDGQPALKLKCYQGA